MIRRAFTVVELLIALAILSIVAASAFPVYRSALAKSRETTCINTLHQLHSAIEIYRANYGGEGVYGGVTEMRLPPYLQWMVRDLGLTHAVMRCCVPGNIHPWSGFTVYYPCPDMGATGDWKGWADYCRTYRDDSILVSDPNHDPKKELYFSPFVIHHSIGMYLDGHVKIKNKRGDPRTREWWND
jgi:prepilin-type N-terminal cleavage/methylation domain-containing protein